MVHVLKASQQLELRGLCAVLLRKALCSDVENKTWNALTPQTQAGLKAELLELIKTEENKSTAKMVCDTVSDVGAMLLEQQQWPELLPFMFTCVQVRQHAPAKKPRLLSLSLSLFPSLPFSLVTFSKRR